jgi:hypothetical protein
MPAASTFNPLRVGAIAGVAVAVSSVAYAAVLAMGFLTLPSPDQPIQDPWFTAMEGTDTLIRSDLGEN